MNKSEEFKKVFSNLETKMEKFREIGFSNLVDWNYLSTVEVGETVTISGVNVKKVHQGDFCMQFISVVPPRCSFPYHWHDFFEMNIILDGQISNGGITYYKGDVIKLKEFIHHEFVNESPTKEVVISTTFTKFEPYFLIK